MLKLLSILIALLLLPTVGIAEEAPAEAPRTIEFVIAGPNILDSNMLETFAADLPELMGAPLSINIGTDMDMTVEGYAAILAAESSEVDIFILDSRERGAYAIIQSGGFKDLFTNEFLEADYLDSNIRSATQYWESNILEMCMYGDAMFGYPLSYYPITVSYCPAYTPEPDLPCLDMTWSQFYRFLDAKQLNFPVSDAIAREVLIDQLSAHVNCTGTVDTDLIREFIRAIELTSAERPAAVPEDAPSAYMSLTSTIRDEYSEFPIPALQGRGEIPIGMCFMLINPYSENIEVALKLIEYYETAGVPGIYSMAHGPQRLLYDCSGYYEEDIPPEWSIRRGQLVSRFKLYWDNPLRSDPELNAALDAYLAGTADLDTTISAVAVAFSK